VNHHLWMRRTALGVLLATILLLPKVAAAQAPPDASTKAATTSAKSNAQPAANAKAWTMPRTADGHPDLHGYYNFLTVTPMERPAKYGNKEFLTPQETEEVFRTGLQSAFEPRDGDEVHYGNELFNPNSVDYDPTTFGLSPWQNGIRPNPRTSLVVDPLDGHIPPRTAAAQAARSRAAQAPPAETAAGANIDLAGSRAGTVVQGHGYVTDDHNGGGIVHADVPLDLGYGTTCVSPGAGPPIFPGEYNADMYILQAPDTLVLQGVNGYRVIPLDGSAHLPSNLHQWQGNGIGHWEGDTLVVETTNFRPDNTYRGANAKTLKITERFTRISVDTIEYKFTINDPSTWTKPWSVILPLSAEKGPIPEFACSENDYDAVNILAGARAAEKKAAEKPGTPISRK
jgi:hypothetical protein